MNYPKLTFLSIDFCNNKQQCQIRLRVLFDFLELTQNSKQLLSNAYIATYAWPNFLGSKMPDSTGEFAPKGEGQYTRGNQF